MKIIIETDAIEIAELLLALEARPEEKVDVESMSEEQMSAKEQGSLKEAAKPLVEFIRKYETPMTTAIVTGAGVELVNTEIHVPFKDDWN